MKNKQLIYTLEQLAIGNEDRVKMLKNKIRVAKLDLDEYIAKMDESNELIRQLKITIETLNLEDSMNEVKS